MDDVKLSYFVQRVYVAIVNNGYDYIPSCDTGQNLRVEKCMLLVLMDPLKPRTHLDIKG